MIGCVRLNREEQRFVILCIVHMFKLIFNLSNISLTHSDIEIIYSPHRNQSDQLLAHSFKQFAKEYPGGYKS